MLRMPLDTEYELIALSTDTLKAEYQLSIVVGTLFALFDSVQLPLLLHVASHSKRTSELHNIYQPPKPQLVFLDHGNGSSLTSNIHSVGVVIKRSKGLTFIL